MENVNYSLYETCKTDKLVRLSAAHEKGNPLVDMLKGYYEEAMGQPVEEIRTPGCVEPAFFCLYHPGLQTTCIGPKITEAHTINETLYLNTLRPVVQTVVNTMQHINMVAR